MIARPRLWRVSLAIWLIAVALRCVLGFGLGRHDYSHAEAQNLALSLARHGTFADAFGPGTGPSAHTGPVYPAINALFFLIAGTSLAADRLRMLFNIALAGAIYASLPFLAARLGLPRRAGIIAGVAGAVLPLYYWGEVPGTFENTLSGLLLVVFSYWVAPYLAGDAKPAANSWALGGLAAVAVLTAPTLLLPIAAVVLLAWSRQPKRPLGMPVRVACAAFLVLAPWTVRNYIRFHSVFFIRSNFGLELADSNNGDATPDAEANYRTAYFQAHHPFANKQAAELAGRVGEVAYSRRLLAEAVAWIRAHPARFARLSAARTVSFWIPASRYPIHRVALAGFTLLAFCGWWTLWLSNRTAFALLAVMPVSYSLTYVLVQESIRFTYPVWWALLLAACAFACRRGNPTAPPPPPTSAPPSRSVPPPPSGLPSNWHS
jgi:hypothetical protein